MTSKYVALLSIAALAFGAGVMAINDGAAQQQNLAELKKDPPPQPKVGPLPGGIAPAPDITKPKTGPFGDFKNPKTWDKPKPRDPGNVDPTGPGIDGTPGGVARTTHETEASKTGIKGKSPFDKGKFHAKHQSELTGDPINVPKSPDAVTTYEKKLGLKDPTKVHSTGRSNIKGLEMKSFATGDGKPRQNNASDPVPDGVAPKATDRPYFDDSGAKPHSKNDSVGSEGVISCAGGNCTKWPSGYEKPPPPPEPSPPPPEPTK